MCASNGKGKRSVAVRNTPHRTGTHMSCGSQCYLPPGGGDIPALTRNRSWYSIKRPRTDARLSCLVMYSDMVHPPEGGHPSQ